MYLFCFRQTWIIIPQRKDEHMYLSIPNESVAAEAEEQLITDGNDIVVLYNKRYSSNRVVLFCF